MFSVCVLGPTLEGWTTEGFQAVAGCGHSVGLFCVPWRSRTTPEPGGLTCALLCAFLGLLSSACCVVQILLGLLSFGCAGLNTVLGPWRPTFLALSIILQAFIWSVVCSLRIILCVASHCPCVLGSVARHRATRSGILDTGRGSSHCHPRATTAPAPCSISLHCRLCLLVAASTGPQLASLDCQRSSPRLFRPRQAQGTGGEDHPCLPG